LLLGLPIFGCIALFGKCAGDEQGAVCQTGVVVARPQYTLRATSKIYPQIEMPPDFFSDLIAAPLCFILKRAPNANRPQNFAKRKPDDCRNQLIFRNRDTDDEWDDF